MKKAIKVFLVILYCLALAYGTLSCTVSIQTLQFWFEHLVPSLFFGMVMVRLILPLPFSLLPIKALNLSGNAITYILSSLLCGSPGCAALIDEAAANKQMTVSQGQRLVYCCQNATPTYILISCGSLLLKSFSSGLKIYLCLLLSNILLLVFTRSVEISEIETTKDNGSFPVRLNQAVISSGYCLFLMGGVLMVVSVSVQLILQFLPEWIHLPLCCFSEFSSGIAMLASVDLPLHLKECFICFILGFGGLSVHLQCLSVTPHLNLDPVLLLLIRFCQGLFASGFCLLL